MMSSNELQKRDKENILGTYARYNACLVKGKGAYCYSPEGKEFIDFSSGIGVNSLGFCDEGWVDAIIEQLKSIQHTSNLFYTEPCGELAEILIKRTGMSRVFFANSGAEANEGAIKAARKYGNCKSEGRNEIISLLNSFHGRTMTTITATGQEEYHRYFDPFASGFLYAEANDINDFRAKISDKTCAVIMELIQGEGGVIPLDQPYIKAVSEICREQDILLIIDEVQTGIGRTGRLFAYEYFDIKPDIVTTAKGLGGGLPIAGILFNEKCAKILQSGDHGTTYGGNPVCCKGAVFIQKKMDEAFLSEVCEKGRYIKERIEKMENVVSLSGMGMMIGVKITGKTAKEAMEAALENGLLILTAKDKIRLLPPLSITYQEIDKGLAILKKILA